MPYRNACMHACMHACMYVSKSVCLSVCPYVCMHTCMYAWANDGYEEIQLLRIDYSDPLKPYQALKEAPMHPSTAQQAEHGVVFGNTELAAPITMEKHSNNNGSKRQALCRIKAVKLLTSCRPFCTLDTVGSPQHAGR